MKAVTVAEVSLSYGPRQILAGVSFYVAAGEFLMIIGPNGTGKTTLLKVIGRLLDPARGRVEILGRSAASYSRREFSRTVALVPQQVVVDFPFTVAETVLMGRSPHLRFWGLEGRQDQEAARQAMQFTEVEHLAGQRVDRLSGGERQRVLIARAICQEPQLLLLDEPTASLDPAHQIKILDLMERLRREKGITILMVSHDLNLAAMYGDRLLLLKDGTVASVGPPARVLTADRLTASYGCPILVDESPLGGVPRTMPVPEKFRQPR